MADYKGIKGFTIQNLSADPPAPIEGQVWYNSTSNDLKGYASVTGAWATGGARNTKLQGSPGAGSQTAAIAMGGNQIPGVLTSNTETYNGSSWTEVNNINTARYNMCDAGTTTAALCAGGTDNLAASLANTETYDGTSWTEVGNLLVSRTHMCENIGIQTAALCVGGPVGNASNESWNGSSWTELANINTGRNTSMGSGTGTAALVIAGENPSGRQNLTESWDGTSWTETGNNVNTARAAGGSAMQGSATSSLIFGGVSGATHYAITESYNGTAWTEVADLVDARSQNGGAGAGGSSALTFGGIQNGAPGITDVTQEWTAGLNTVTFTDS